MEAWTESRTKPTSSVNTASAKTLAQGDESELPSALHCVLYPAALAGGDPVKGALQRFWNNTVSTTSRCLQTPEEANAFKQTKVTNWKMWLLFLTVVRGQGNWSHVSAHGLYPSVHAGGIIIVTRVMHSMCIVQQSHFVFFTKYLLNVLRIKKSLQLHCAEISHISPTYLHSSAYY